MVGERDVFRRRLVHVQPIRMRVVGAKESKPALAEFCHYTRDLFGRNFVIADRISGDVLRRERLRYQSVPSRQNSAAFLMRLATGMRQELAVHFAATLDGVK